MGRFRGDGFDVVCSHPRSKSPFKLAQALGYSCNYFFAKVSGRLSFDAFKATLASAGLGARTGVNASGESAGLLRDGEWQVLLGAQVLSDHATYAQAYRAVEAEADRAAERAISGEHLSVPFRARYFGFRV